MMPFVTRFRLLAWVLLVGVAQLLGQDPVKSIDAQILANIEQRLTSDNPAQVAWGGYLAQRYRVRSATRPLCAALDRWKDRLGLKARIVRLHLVDGLVGIKARVPAEQIEFLLDDKMIRAGALAVMAQDVAANQEGLLRLALAPAAPLDLARTAAGRLLVERGLRVRRLGKYVVQSARCSLTMLVKGDELTETAQFAWGQDLVGDKSIKTMIGYPPLVRLELQESFDDLNTIRLLVPGRVGDLPIVLTRMEKASYHPEELEHDPEVLQLPLPREIACLLHHMSGESAPPFTFVQHQWRDAETFLKAYTKLRDARRRSLDKAVAELRKRGWLGKDDLPGFRIKLQENVLDERGAKAEKLPKIPEPPGLILK